MNKSELIQAVVDGTGVTKSNATATVNCVLDSISASLTKGESVSLPGFGTFSVSERAARDGRNPQTGATVKIPASKTVRFKVGKTLKDSVNS